MDQEGAEHHGSGGDLLGEGLFTGACAELPVAPPLDTEGCTAATNEGAAAGTRGDNGLGSGLGERSLCGSTGKTCRWGKAAGEAEGTTR